MGNGYACGTVTAASRYSCDWERQPDGTQKCIRCGRRCKLPIAVNCPKATPALPEPGLAQQAWTYASAVEKWLLAGSPTRTQAEIDRIFAICQSCPMFVAEARPRCRLCGCSLNKAPHGLMNKIAMATEGCPKLPPLWEPKT